MSGYADARAFRAALEDRLRQLARESARPLDRLRKEAASQRLLARFVAVAPPDDWALKGGLALIARLGAGARGTRDADATWRGNTRALQDILDDLMDHDAGDWFSFEIGAGRDISAEGPEGGLRFPVLARLDGREFERFTLDVNLLPGDTRPVEPVTLRNLFEFAGLDAVVVPMIPAAQQLAEKLHAYTRNYGEASSRSKDLYDMLVVALELPLPEAAALSMVAQETFDLRRTAWPPELHPPPPEWEAAWGGFVTTFADVERLLLRRPFVVDGEPGIVLTDTFQLGEAGEGTGCWDIGDYLTRQEKLALLAAELRVDGKGVLALGDITWTVLAPNDHGDWINQRSESFTSLMPVHAEGEPSMLALRTKGLKTNRDAWNYNSSRSVVEGNAERMVAHLNAEVARFATAHPTLSGTLKSRAAVAEAFVDKDPTKFSWERANYSDVARGSSFSCSDVSVHTATYRPFHRRWANFGRRLNSMVYQLSKVYPSAEVSNLAIGVLEPSSPAPFSALCSKELSDDKLVGAGNAMQFLPQYVYDAATDGADPPGLFDVTDPLSSDGRRHNITDHALAAYRALDPAIDRDDIFFYTYGVLHSPDYRTAFAADLKKSLPRIPQVATAPDFWAFSKAGRDLAELHTEYETVEPWSDLTYTYAAGFDVWHPDAYRVLKLKHPRVTDPHDPKGGKVDDRSRVVYNDWITIGGIPQRAYDYELGSRSAIGWVMESNRVRTDKASGIRNDPNDWAAEHDDPTYILDLVGRVVTVSMRTLDIVDSLPHLDL